jgi:valyl-tRNA synthetase
VINLKLAPKIKEVRFNPKLEKKISQKWEKEKIYEFNLKTKKKIFSIDTPPPYPSGAIWHIGAVAHYSQIDMIARTARMLGFNVFFPIGIDRNGIGVERYAEKRFNISLHEMPREEFLAYCKKALDELEAEMLDTMKRLGISGDFDNYYQTDSESYRKLTQSTFIELWNKGLIYTDTRPNNFCPNCRTTIADAEVIYEEMETELVYVKFKVRETKEDLIVATTRPELICACQAVLVHPQDERYKRFVGRHAIIPIYGREVPILANTSVDPKFGSGVVMICSYGDSEDVRLFRELKLQEIIAVDEQGKMTKNAGAYSGLTTKDARIQIVKDLENNGLLVKKESIIHRTPVCEKCRTPIEIIPMNEFYLKQLPFKDSIRKCGEAMTFYPEMHRQLLLNWIDSITIDWPISRRRYYATEIPVWYCKSCGEVHIPKLGKYYKPWKEKAPFEKCSKCGGKEFIGETRTFDTWFDSSVSPLFISKYLEDEKFFKKAYPVSIRPQGKDIVRTWLYYTLLRCYLAVGIFPFKAAWISGYCVDEKGEKMSKSKGNVIDPKPIIEKYGADAFRFWSAQEASLGFDFRASEERIANASKFLTKLWNIARFISMFPVVKKAKLMPADEWILGELAETSKAVQEGYKSFNFFIPATRMREFLWNLFANHYIEMVKARAYGKGFSKQEQKAAWFTLHTCLRVSLKLLAPIIPFITDYIWRSLYSKGSIHKEKFEKIDWKRKEKLTEQILEFNSKVWGIKKEKGVPLTAEIQITIPKELKKLEKDLKAMHNIKD